jgi:tetratricopeptide (TPR) repeat protein
MSPLRPTQLGYDGHYTSGSGTQNHHGHNNARVVHRPKSPHSIYRKSIARGNAWNSKGLKKASEGIWQDALACWENALEIRRHLLGPHHVDVASTLNNQGIALGKMGRYDEALEALNQALKIRMDLWKTKPSTVCDCTTILSTLHNLSNVHQQAGQWKEALEILEEARKLGHDHSAPNLPRARIAVTMGHALWMAPDSTSCRTVGRLARAKEALLEARMLLFDERQQQQRQLASGSVSEENLIGAILTTQQELLDVERDLKELGVVWR